MTTEIKVDLVDLGRLQPTGSTTKTCVAWAKHTRIMLTTVLMEAVAKAR